MSCSNATPPAQPTWKCWPYLPRGARGRGRRTASAPGGVHGAHHPNLRRPRLGRVDRGPVGGRRVARRQNARTPGPRPPLDTTAAPTKPPDRSRLTRPFVRQDDAPGHRPISWPSEPFEPAGPSPAWRTRCSPRLVRGRRHRSSIPSCAPSSRKPRAAPTPPGLGHPSPPLPQQTGGKDARGGRRSRQPGRPTAPPHGRGQHADAGSPAPPQNRAPVGRRGPLQGGPGRVPGRVREPDRQPAERPDVTGDCVGSCASTPAATPTSSCGLSQLLCLAHNLREHGGGERWLTTTTNIGG